MKIVAITAFPFSLPTRRDFRWAGMLGDLGNFVAVKIETEAGVVGWGEATPLPDWGGDFSRHSGETLKTVIEMVETVFAPALIGLNVQNVTLAAQIMDRVAVGNVYAKCALSIALYDAWGKTVGLPIYRLLGGAVRETVPVAHMVGLMPYEEAVKEAEMAIEDGVHALQIKGGVDAERDVALIADLRRRLGDGVMLRLDANQGYGHAKNARSIVQKLVDAGVTYVEQPSEGLRYMAEVTQHAAVSVVADESCWDIADAFDVVRERAADCLSIYLAKAGGFSGACKVADFAEANLMPCDVNGSIESCIGTAANVHFALARPSVTLPAVITISAPSGTHPYRVAGHYYDDDVLAEPMITRDGGICPLDAPGLGITIDEAKLQSFRIDR
ncbi:mandelate racemase/muconate lactonizing enzyme family protein [Gluconobacter wancherniae]|uniref:mandelate racemase/muconate lactonizing enzyme family protein n=1 Tax=Gluconobacter wancherniae TaxID=1307955 RepID=UPI001B8B6D8A|nr:enolase C-terminal domain-like protein [Gluconobacter wancherniae]MBS1089719.1 muconate cycloisomerase [Gluconobacter wancherniae]